MLRKLKIEERIEIDRIYHFDVYLLIKCARRRIASMHEFLVR